MKLPFFSGRKPDREYFFGLFLKENRGIGYIFARQDNKISLLTKQEFKFSNAWENLTNDVDEVLFKMENETKTRVNKMIVFLFSHLIDERTKEIKRPYLQKIKELTRNLEIKPIGYIECYEAVAYFLQQRDGSPLTSILIELDENSVDVFIYKGGHKVHSSIIARTDNIVSDLHEVFDALGSTLLPNRIILYNSSGLVEESTKIISHKWSSDLFVQIPRVEILKETDILDGCMSIFEDQLGQEGAEDAHSPSSDAPEFVGPEGENETKKRMDRKPGNVLGFAVGQDILELEAPPKATAPEEKMGFTVAEREARPARPPGKKFDPKAALAAATAFFGRIPFKRASTVILPLILIVGILAAVELLSHKAVIHVVLPSQAIEKNIASDAAIGETLPDAITIEVATSSVQLSDVRATTGKRDVGDKAQGEVTVYNFDDKEKTFSQGTVIQTDNLKFTLNDDVTVAASTLASDASAKLPGKSKIKVTGSDIGPESNLDKGKRFTIADLSSSTYFAMNEAGFSGGTRKTIKTVSKKDMDDLETSIMNKAKQEQQQELTAKSNGQVTMVDSLTDYQLTDPKYSKELGEEADTITLKANVLATYYYFDNTYLNSKLKEELGKDVSSGYELNEKNITYTISKVNKDKAGIHLDISAKAKATKSFDQKAVLATFTGRSVKDVQRLLTDMYAATDDTVTIYPQLPPFNTLLPFSKQNIDLRVEWQ